MQFKKSLLILGSLIALSACQTDSWGDGETIGTLGGAAAGGLLGSAIGHGSAAGTAVGVLLGGFVGNELGGLVDDQDRRREAAAQQRAYGAPIGQQITWNNPQNGHSGTIVPLRQGTNASGSFCREYQETVTIGGAQHQAYGTACRQPDGSWKVVS